MYNGNMNYGIMEYSRPLYRPISSSRLRYEAFGSGSGMYVSATIPYNPG